MLLCMLTSFLRSKFYLSFFNQDQEEGTIPDTNTTDDGELH